MKSLQKTDLSIIILNYNTKVFLAGCLVSVKKAIEQAKIFNIETIVVDNASDDGSAEMVKRQFKWAKLVVSKKNLGFAGGNNLGVTRAKGRFVLFLNSDTVVKSAAFLKSIEFMDLHPRAGALSAKTLLANGRLDPDCHRGFPTPWASFCYFVGLEKLFPRSRLFGGYHQGYKDLSQNHRIEAGAGAFMLIRAEVINRVGGWDDAYFFYGEDLDFFYRIKQAGWEVWFLAEPLLTHFKGVSSGLRKESKNITRASRETRLKVAQSSVKAMEIFYRKFYQNRYPRLVTELILVGIRLKGGLRYLKQFLKK